MRSTIKTLGILAMALTLALAGVTWALDAGTSKFLTDAIRGHLAAAKMGKLAEQSGQSKEVRAFGKTLLSDHSIAFEKSSSLAEKLGMTAPVEMTPEAEKSYEAMSKLTGTEFDKQFVAQFVTGSQKEIDAYWNEALKGTNPQVVAFAEETLPTLKQHFARAQVIDKDLKVIELARKGP